MSAPQGPGSASSIEGVEGIVWDLDETLTRDETVVVGAFARAGDVASPRAAVPAGELGEIARRCARLRWRSSPFRAYCLRLGISSWEGLWGPFDGASEGDGEELRRLRDWLPEYRAAAWADTLAAFGIEDAPLAHAMSDAFRKCLASAHVLYPDAAEALASLHGALPMGLLTNGDSSVQRHKVRTAGIGHYFQSILVSGEVGIGKPDGKPFAEIARRLGLRPAGLLMIGDHLERDVQGALDAGFRAVWLDRPATAGEALRAEHREGPSPTGIIRIEGLADLDYGALRAGRVVLTTA